MTAARSPRGPSITIVVLPTPEPSQRRGRPSGAKTRPNRGHATVTRAGADHNTDPSSMSHTKPLARTTLGGVDPAASNVFAVPAATARQRVTLTKRTRSCATAAAETERPKGAIHHVTRIMMTATATSNSIKTTPTVDLGDAIRHDAARARCRPRETGYTRATLGFGSPPSGGGGMAVAPASIRA